MQPSVARSRNGPRSEHVKRVPTTASHITARRLRGVQPGDAPLFETLKLETLLSGLYQSRMGVWESEKRIFFSARPNHGGPRRGGARSARGLAPLSLPAQIRFPPPLAGPAHAWSQLRDDYVHTAYISVRYKIVKLRRYCIEK